MLCCSWNCTLSSYICSGSLPPLTLSATIQQGPFFFTVALSASSIEPGTQYKLGFLEEPRCSTIVPPHSKPLGKSPTRNQHSSFLNDRAGKPKQFLLYILLQWDCGVGSLVSRIDPLCMEEEGKARSVKQIHVAYRESRPLTVKNCRQSEIFILTS